MIRGIGVDIVEIARFRRFVDEGNTGLLERLFSDREQEACARRADPASCYAARFAAKEAFLKALGTGLRGGIGWHDVEVVSDRLGKPGLHLSGHARQRFEEERLSASFLSISHDGGSAVAMVVLEET